jgi:hypothetical protein
MRCWRRLAVVSAAVLLLVACKRDAREEKAGEPWEITWPGGSVKIDPEKGVDVKAPGVDVNVDRDRGVKVKAPPHGRECRQGPGRRSESARHRC